MRRLITHRDARIYIAGQSFSIIGDSALWLAMGIWVKILTGSNSAAGLTFFAFVCGCMTAPLSGVAVDRLRRRPLLIAANLGGAALVCVLLLVHGRGQVWLIYAVMFGYGAVNGLITAAQTALLTALVPGDLLAVAATGAYCRSMASNYNHIGRPAVVSVRDGAARLLLHRETIEDLLRLDAG